MLMIKKESAWQFVTSSSGGVGVEFFLAEGGAIYFKDPSGVAVSYTYGAAGAGLAFGLKLPKVGKLQLQVKGKTVGGGVAPAAFPNTGKLYILDSFAGNELKRSDMTGCCMFVQAGGGVIGGGSAYAMVLGMNPIYLVGMTFTPLMLLAETKLLQSATALLLMAGLNVGVQAGGGAGAFIGGLI
jgi:hypothetical protein